MYRCRSTCLVGVLAMLAAMHTCSEPLPVRQIELEHLLRHDCGSCHGLTLRGGLGPPLTPAALSGRSPLVLETIIAHGIPGTPMPPWRSLLSEAEINWLVAYLQRGLPPVESAGNANGLEVQP